MVRSDSGTAAMKPPFPGPYGRKCQFLAKAGERFTQGSVLAPTLFNLYTNDLTVTRSRRFIYANDILLCPPSGNFLRDRVLSGSRSCPSCQILSAVSLWRMKPNTSKPVTSVFHLHNNRLRRELDVHMNGQSLKYLGVTLDRTLSFKEHLSRSAAKLKSS